MVVVANLLEFLGNLHHLAERFSAAVDSKVIHCKAMEISTTRSTTTIGAIMCGLVELTVTSALPIWQ